MVSQYSAYFEFIPNLPLVVNYDKATPVPVNISLDMNMDFVPTGAPGDPFDRFFLRILINDPLVSGTATRIIGFSGDIPEAPQQTIEVVEGLGTYSSIILSFASLTGVPNGSYNTNVSFILSGERGGNLYILDSVTDAITVNISGAGGGEPPIETIGVSPGQLVFTHALDGALPPSKTVAVTSKGAFKASVFGAVSLSGSSLTLVSNINGIKEYLGMVDQTVTVALHPEVGNEAPGIHEYLVTFSQTDGKSAFIGNLGVTLYLFENSDIVINPTALEFFAIKDIQEAPPQSLQVAGTPTFTVMRPSWLIVTPTTGQGFTDITVTPNPTSAMAEGEYQGDIVINDGTNNYTIPVLHNVYGNVQLGASPNKINFTDDYNTISRFYEQINYHLLLKLDVMFFNYGATLLNETTLNYVLGFFNNRTSFFVGKTLNSILKELLKLQTIRMDNLAVDLTSSLMPIRNYYLPAKVDIEAIFKHSSDALLDKTHTFEGLKFIKGRRPKTPFTDTFILDYYRDPLRVTVNSVAMFNFYKEKNHVFRIYKNGTFKTSVTHSVGTQRIFGYKLAFADYAQGDVVELRLYKNIDGAVDEDWFNDPANYIAQQYVLIPEGKASHHIGYEDEHGLLKIIEFTGGISFENAYENTVAKNYEEFLETLKKLDSKKTRKCSIDTGFIFKSNTKNIDALLSSNRAWLISNEKKQSISMIPTNKSMSDEDSEQDLYAYTIEFEINFNNDFEINT